MRLVLASQNLGKLHELRALLADLPIEIVSIDDACPGWTVEETGATLVENARIKATAACAATQIIALADDSGLEVDALEGAPGVHSARYAGSDQNAAANRAKLLQALAAIPPTQRGARFRCVLCLAFPDGKIVSTEGVCEGRIAFGERGSGGFGYDPIIEMVDFPGRTMAELSLEEKNAVSHRARALRQLRGTLAELLKTV